MGLTLSWEPEKQSSGFDNEAWPLLHELIPNGQPILRDTSQKALQDALEALKDAAFGP